MSKKKKQQINEDIRGAIMLTPLLPVGAVHGFSSKKSDNFEFKGFPGQFDENGKKIIENKVKLIESAFTKKHYITIAKILKDSRNVRDVIYKMVDMFTEDNSLFKKEFFLKAAGE